MKEYKVVKFNASFGFNMNKYNVKLEKFLNDYARQGWSLKETNASFNIFIFERNKN